MSLWDSRADLSSLLAQSFFSGVDPALRRDSTEQELLRQVGTPSLGSSH